VLSLTTAEVSSEGNTDSLFLGLDRVLFRNQNSKHTVSAELKRDATESFIADTKIDVQSRSLNSLSFSSQSAIGFGSNVLILTPEIALGLSEVDNLPDGSNTPVENPQAEYTRFRMTLDWIQSIKLGDVAFNWSSRLRGQYSDDPLYSSQQLIVGGAGSVRGFDELSIIGDRGYFWQNSLNYRHNIMYGPYPGALDFMVGYDMGYVQSVRPDAFDGSMTGATAGVTLTVDPVSVGVTVGWPLSVDGGLDKGPSHAVTTLGINF